MANQKVNQAPSFFGHKKDLGKQAKNNSLFLDLDAFNELTNVKQELDVLWEYW